MITNCRVGPYALDSEFLHHTNPSELVALKQSEHKDRTKTIVLKIAQESERNPRNIMKLSRS